MKGKDVYRKREIQREGETGRERGKRQEAAYVLEVKPQVLLTPHHWHSKPIKRLLYTQTERS